MKGFHVLHAACAKLWSKRRDFELVVTSDPPGQLDEMTRYIGWQPQHELPSRLREADFLVFPTIAEEALGRTAVEAMGVGRPVIASRIGGLPFTVTEGLTGLLFEPGNVDELAAKMELLLDDPALCERMGAAGRQRFMQEFTWDAIIQKHYRGLLGPTTTKYAARASAGNSPREVSASGEFDNLLHETGRFFGIKRPDIERMFDTYRSMRMARRPADCPVRFAGLGMAEGFVVCLLLSLSRHHTIVLGGTPSSETIRDFEDLKLLLGLPSAIVQFDVPGSFQSDILDRYGSGFVWLEPPEHCGSLCEEIIVQSSRHFGQWIVAVAAESLRAGQASARPAVLTLTDGEGFQGTSVEQFTATHRLRVFEATNGLTVFVPNSIGASTVSS